MSLINDQTANTDPTLLGRFIAALKFVVAAIVEEQLDTPDHVARIALARKVMLDRQADNYGRVILELAVARSAKLRSLGSEIADDDIVQVVRHYVDIFAREGW
jgi:hypothetical protein